MKTKMTYVFTVIACLILSACAQPKTEKKKDYFGWKRTEIKSRVQADGTEMPTKYVLDCRHVTEAENVHYYYSVVADPTPEIVKTDSGTTEMIYKNANLVISQTISSVEETVHLYKGILHVDVDFKIVKAENGTALAIATANEKTVNLLKPFYDHEPYFSDIQKGDEIFVLQHESLQGQPKNLTQIPIPGLNEHDALECR